MCEFPYATSSRVNHLKVLKVTFLRCFSYSFSCSRAQSKRPKDSGFSCARIDYYEVTYPRFSLNFNIMSV
jgi:hypothetical protein